MLHGSEKFTYICRRMNTGILNSIINKSSKTRQQIADEMGLTRMQLYRLLSNPSRMRLDQMLKLCQILGKSPRYMISIMKNA